VRFRTFLFTVLATSLILLPSPASEPEAKSHDLASRVNAIIDGPDYKHATWGILVVEAHTGRTVYQRNPDTMLAPASVTKLFSCATALITLGPDSITETVVYSRGLKLNGVLRGDLILVAAGDLTFGGRTKDGRTIFTNKDHTYANSGFGDAELTDTDPLAALNSLAKQVRDAGITQVDGEVIIDDRMFARTRGSGSGPDVVSPIMVNDNLIDFVIEPATKPGEPARVKLRPETAYYQVDAVVNTGPPKSGKTIQILPIGPNHLAVRGSIGVDSGPTVRIYPVDDPTAFARTLFIEALRRHGVQAKAALLRPGMVALPATSDYSRLPRVGVFRSPPFRDVITVTLKVSHNLYASTLPCLVAAAKGHTTAEAGLREQQKVLRELGVDIGQVSFSGGAGGGAADHVTPRATVQLLQGMAKRPEWGAFKAAMPSLGIDGTLYDAVGENSQAKGKVFAKTGTLVWYDAVNDRILLKSKALAGTMTTRNGKELLFAFIVNNVPLPAGVTSAREGKVLAKLCEILYAHGP